MREVLYLHAAKIFLHAYLSALEELMVFELLTDEAVSLDQFLTD